MFLEMPRMAPKISGFLGKPTAFEVSLDPQSAHLYCPFYAGGIRLEESAISISAS